MMNRLILVLLATATLGACASQNTHTAQLESHACAQLGLAPGDAGYSNCVANLDMTLHDDDHPGASS